MTRIKNGRFSCYSETYFCRHGNHESSQSQSAKISRGQGRQKSSGTITCYVSAKRNKFVKALLLPLMGPIPWSLATADGHMVKSSKAQLMHQREKDGKPLPSEASNVSSSVHIIDGNALLQACIHRPDNFGQLAHQVFMCLPKSETVHFVTDSYKQARIKQLERERRGETGIYSIGVPLTKLPHDFKSFMLNLNKFLINNSFYDSTTRCYGVHN